MITMIGTGHVFRITEQVSFIIKNIWPDAVLVELDETRYKALTEPSSDKKIENPNISKIYRRSAKYQDSISEKNDTRTGGELLAAINTGKLAGAEIICIDDDAERIMKELEEEMSFLERGRYSLSIINDRIMGNRKVVKTQNELFMNETKYMEEMRRKYPTLVRKLIDERNAFMAEKIKKASERYNSLVVVVGDAHVEGLCELIGDPTLKKIRLSDLLDQEKMDRIRSEIWNGGDTL